MPRGPKREKTPGRSHRQRSPRHADATGQVVTDPTVIKCLLAITLVLAQPALADSSSAPTAALPSPQQPSSASQTSAVRGPPNCDDSLPPGVPRPNTQSATLFSFRLTPEGEVRDVALFKSSGNQDLDRATLQCASSLHFGSPMTVAGKPVEVTWIEGYFWRPRWSTFATVSPTGTPNLCLPTAYPRSAVVNHVEGFTTLSYHIGVDGIV